MELKFGHLLLALLILGAFVYFAPQMGIDLSKFKLFQEVTTETSQEPTISQPTTGGQTNIYAISSVSFKPYVTDALNETEETLDVTFYYWEEGMTDPATISISGGTGTATVAPNQKLTWAAGSDGSVYWERGTAEIGYRSITFPVKLYTVAGANDVVVKLYKDYTDITDGASNVSVGAGETVQLTLTIDDVGEYTAVRSPTICVDYNTSVVKKVKISGLTEEVSVPTRLIAGLDQCFKTGIDYYKYSDPKLQYTVDVQILSGVDPDVNNSKMTWYVLDKDLYYRDGELYYVNPITMANMGSTTNWSADTYFQ